MSTSTAARRDIARARRALSRAGWASFDVFETLLRRDLLAPVHVFGLLHDEMSARPGYSAIERADFIRLRMRAERLARRRARLEEGHVEVTFAEIWRELVRERPEFDPDEGARGEIAVETRVLTQRESGVALYRQARERGLRVVCVSDMYHSSDTIAGWLAAIDVVPDAIFVSCEHRRGKRDGLLGDVARSLALSPRRGLHIGDSERADGAGARASGLAARVIPHGSATLMPLVGTARTLAATESQLLQRAAHHWSDHGTGDLAVDIGHSILGPAVAGHGAFAAGRERDLGIDVSLYTSRDTRLVHDIVRDTVRDCGVGGDTRREYAHLSRQSLYVPSMAGGFADGDLDLLVGGAWPMEARHFLSRLGLDPEIHRGALGRRGLAPESMVATTSDKAAVAATLSDLEPFVREIATERLSEFGRYMESLGVMSARSVLLVELGWRGTVRNTLARCLALLGWTGTLHGAYLALLWRPWPTHDDAATWLTGHPRNQLFHHALAGAVPVVEAMFQADEPSVERYAAGRPHLAGPVGTREVLDPIQNGAREYLTANRAAVTALIDDGRPDPALALPMVRLLRSPSREEARLLGRCTYADGFGTDAPRRTILPLGRGDTGGTQWRAGRAAIGL